MGIFSSIGKVLKSVAKVAIPAAVAYYGGSALAGSSLFSSAAGAAASTGGYLGSTGELGSMLATTAGGLGTASAATSSLASSGLFNGIGSLINSGSFSSALGAYGAYKGTQATNAQQIALSEEQMRFQAASQMEAERYDTQMSNTSYQRGVADMRAAGLNPMLGYSQGGASTPTVGSLPGSQPPQLHNAGLEAINTGMAIKNQMANIENVSSQTAVNKAQVANVNASTAKTQAETLKVGAETQGQININSRFDFEKLYKWFYEPGNWNSESATYDTKLKIATTARAAIDQMNEWAVKNYGVNAMALAEKLGISNEAADYRIKQLSMPGHEAESRMYKRSGGDIIPYIPTAARAAGALGGAAIGSSLIGNIFK
ncbi:MAG: DNA pilot protein [Microviridae sp.]|nr:MAG: DNA pilot protein [Microviridae sp.]